jgi:hypothetical protein
LGGKDLEYFLNNLFPPIYWQIKYSLVLMVKKLTYLKKKKKNF